MIRRRRRLTRRPWHEVDCWALDLEMSGLDRRRDVIVAAGMVPVRGRAVRLGEGFASLVRPDGPVGTSGIAAHHILPSELAGAPGLGAVLGEIDRRLDGSVLVVHVGAIDLPFLRRAHRQAGVRWPAPPVVDTLALLQRHERHRFVHEPAEGGVPAGLAAARAMVGLPAHDSHDAFADAVATAELLLVLAHRLGARTVDDLL